MVVSLKNKELNIYEYIEAFIVSCASKLEFQTFRKQKSTSASKKGFPIAPT